MLNLTVTNGLKTAKEWHALTPERKALWLAQLDLVSVRAQASAVAVASHGDTRRVLVAWVALGLLGAERLGPALAARAGEVAR